MQYLILLISKAGPDESGFQFHLWKNDYKFFHGTPYIIGIPLWIVIGGGCQPPPFSHPLIFLKLTLIRPLVGIMGVKTEGKDPVLGSPPEVTLVGKRHLPP